MWPWITNIIGAATKADLKAQETRMNARIALLQATLTAGFATANTRLDRIEASKSAEDKALADVTAAETTDRATITQMQQEEVDLKAQIADLQKKVDAGTFTDEDAAALSSIEAQYETLAARISKDAGPDLPPAPTTAPTE